MLIWIPGMAGTSTGVYKFHSVVRDHHRIYIYKTVWTLVIDETLQVAQEDPAANTTNTL